MTRAYTLDLAPPARETGTHKDRCWQAVRLELAKWLTCRHSHANDEMLLLCLQGCSNHMGVSTDITGWAVLEVAVCSEIVPSMNLCCSTCQIGDGI